MLKWTGLITLALLLVMEEISTRWALCYGGRFVFFSLTDDTIVLGSSIFTQRTWGDWGWWIQSPWRDQGSRLSHALLPRTITARQFWAPALNLSLPLLILCASVASSLLWARNIPPKARRLVCWVGLCAYFSLLALSSSTIVEWIAKTWNLSGNIRPDVMYLLILTCVAVAPLWWVELTTPRHLPGHCKKCRYNLKGNVSGICSECGTPIPPDDRPDHAA